MFDRLYSTQDLFPEIIMTVPLVLLCVLAYVKLFGLRTFAKFNAIDFTTTIVIGSILASTIMLQDVSVLKGMSAVLTILGFQALFTYIINKSWVSKKLITNTPLYLYKDGNFIINNMKKGDISKSIVMEKLRQNNVHTLQQVSHIIFETTGSISVLYSADNMKVDEEILEGVVS